MTRDEDDAAGAGPAQDATDYDQLPYLAMPISYTQPSRLAALGRLMGLDSPDPATARVVELGCAGGGNLVPMAARHAGGRFLGFDLSARQVEAGQARVRALGLANVTLRQGDIATLDLPPASVDYLVCHGVFSWVPAPVQAAILKLAAGCLVPGGIAAVSYNTLPGWHLRSPLRDILLHAAGPEGRPQDRVARARAALRRLADETSPRHGYGAVLRAEAARMATMPSSYLMGEFLAEHNTPVSFATFLGLAEAQGLAYLAEADLSAAACQLVPQAARPPLRDLAGPGRVEAETWLDFVSGRPFRRTLLVRSDDAARAGPPRHATLARLHVAAHLSRDPAGDADTGPRFRDATGRPVSSADGAVSAMLAALADAWPGTVAVTDLAGQELAGAERAGADRQARRVARAVLDLVATGRATLHASPLRVGRAADPRPTAWWLAREEARAGHPSVTGLNHGTVILDPTGRAIAARLDGRATPGALASWLQSEWEQGRLLPEHRNGSADADAEVARWLSILERGAVLDVT